MEPLRIGILGAARITELALIKLAAITGTRLVAVAARDQSRAQAFAEKYGVEKALGSYHDVINDPQVEAVYNPLSNSLHAKWNVAAPEVGKHVFTEKPSASNAAEAEFVQKVVNSNDRVFFEGFHYYYHPLITRLHEILASGEIGTAGCNMASDHHEMSHKLIGSAGEAVIVDFVNPHNDDRLIITTANETRTEHLGNRSSHTYQLEAFTTAVRSGESSRTDAAGAVATMQLIDDCYRSAGFATRPGAS